MIGHGEGGVIGHGEGRVIGDGEGRVIGHGEGGVIGYIFQTECIIFSSLSLNLHLHLHLLKDLGFDWSSEPQRGPTVRGTIRRARSDISAWEPYVVIPALGGRSRGRPSVDGSRM